MNDHDESFEMSMDERDLVPETAAGPLEITDEMLFGDGGAVAPITVCHWMSVAAIPVR